MKAWQQCNSAITYCLKQISMQVIRNFYQKLIEFSTPLLSLPVFFPKHCKLIDFLKVCSADGLEAIDLFFLTERTILKSCSNSFLFEDKKSIHFFRSPRYIILWESHCYTFICISNVVAQRFPDYFKIILYKDNSLSMQSGLKD